MKNGYSAYQHERPQRNTYKRSYAGKCALAMLCSLGIIGVLFVVSYIREEPIPQPVVASAPAEPVIKNYSDYKAKFPSPAEKRKAALKRSDKRILDDLISSGAKP